jgi:hypothetical protein
MAHTTMHATMKTMMPLKISGRRVIVSCAFQQNRRTTHTNTQRLSGIVVGRSHVFHDFAQIAWTCLHIVGRGSFSLRNETVVCYFLFKRVFYCIGLDTPFVSMKKSSHGKNLTFSDNEAKYFP